MKKRGIPRPSKWAEDYWIWAHAPGSWRIEEDTEERTAKRIGLLTEGKLKSGKWLIFVWPKNVDEAWQKIKAATEAGKLGPSAKVATAMPSPSNPDPTKVARVICVYTSDWTNRDDVMRVREELRKLGITNRISYKADEDTLKGRYVERGHRRIAKYWA